MWFIAKITFCRLWARPHHEIYLQSGTKIPFPYKSALDSAPFFFSHSHFHTLYIFLSLSLFSCQLWGEFDKIYLARPVLEFIWNGEWIHAAIEP